MDKAKVDFDSVTDRASILFSLDLGCCQALLLSAGPNRAVQALCGHEGS